MLTGYPAPVLLVSVIITNATFFPYFSNILVNFLISISPKNGFSLPTFSKGNSLNKSSLNKSIPSNPAIFELARVVSNNPLDTIIGSFSCFQ
jgi:hypothetical protein